MSKNVREVCQLSKTYTNMYDNSNVYFSQKGQLYSYV